MSVDDELPNRSPAAPTTVETIEIREGNLFGIRRAVEKRALLDGVRPERLRDVLLAATEAAANSLDHAAGSGVLRFWREESRFVLEVADRGVFVDPVVGRRAPPVEAARGRGLWIIKQLSDLLQVDSGEHGSVVRMHFDVA